MNCRGRCYCRKSTCNPKTGICPGKSGDPDEPGLNCVPGMVSPQCNQRELSKHELLLVSVFPGWIQGFFIAFHLTQ